MNCSLDSWIYSSAEARLFFHKAEIFASTANSRANDDVVAALSRTYLKIPCVCPCLTHTHLWSESRCGLIHEPGWPCVIEFHRRGGIWRGSPGYLVPFLVATLLKRPTHYRYPYVSEMKSPSNTCGLGLRLGSTDNATLITTVVYIVWP